MSSTCFWTDEIGCAEKCPQVWTPTYQGEMGTAAFGVAYNVNTGDDYFGVYMGSGLQYNASCQSSRTWSNTIPPFTSITLVSIQCRCYPTGAYSSTQVPLPEFMSDIEPCTQGTLYPGGPSVYNVSMLQDFTVLDANIVSPFPGLTGGGVSLWEQASLLTALGHADAIDDFSNTNNSADVEAIFLLNGSGTPYDGYYRAVSMGKQILY